MVERRWPIALRVSSRPWAIAAGVRGALAAGLIALLGVVTGRMDAVGLMYFGAACSVAFAVGLTTRIRLIGIAGQTMGAAAGLVIGALSTPDPVVMVVAVAIASFCSGVIGRFGPPSAAFATMLVIGVAFAQFSGIGLPWIGQIAWYCSGSAIVGLATLPMFGRRHLLEERTAIAEVFQAAADLMASAGSASAGATRARLAAASAAARTAWYDDRLSVKFEQGPRYREVARQLRSAQAVALRAAASYRDGAPAAAATVEAARDHARYLTAAAECSDTMRDGPPTAAPDSALAAGETISPPPRHHGRFSAALAGSTSAQSLLAGLRVAICMTVATTTTLLLHDPAHSFWLPLTVAVVVRPEYASVYVRTLNRLLGTVIGAAVATIPLLLFGSGWPIAVCAALALGFAAAAAPKLYALSVIGITTSALLSTSIATADPVAPIFRLGDTLLGCLIAMVFGYLLWPRRYRAPDGLDPAPGVDAALDYLAAVEEPDAHQVDDGTLSMRRDRAYQGAHRFRFATQSALAEPPPVRTIGTALLPVALQLEDLVDDITAFAQKSRDANPTPDPAVAHSIRDQLENLTRDR